MDQVDDALLDLLLAARKEQVVEAVPRLSSNLTLDLGPVAVAEPVRQHKQQVIRVLAEELGLLRLLPRELFQCEIVLHRRHLLRDDFRRAHVEIHVFLRFFYFLYYFGAII